MFVYKLPFNSFNTCNMLAFVISFNSVSNGLVPYQMSYLSKYILLSLYKDVIDINKCGFLGFHIVLVFCIYYTKLCLHTASTFGTKDCT